MSGPIYGRCRRDAVDPEIVRVYQAAGFFVVPLNGRGIPDLLVGYPGGWFLSENKTGNGKLTEAQEKWHASAARAGAPVHIVRSAAHARKLVRMLQAEPENDTPASWRGKESEG